MSLTATTSPTAALVLQHGAQARPAWLFSAEGELIWRNRAAAYFLGKFKKSGGIKLAAPARPIRGQIARVLRLGTPGRASLSRIQFQAGEKPGSATCACTPLTWIDGRQALLIVGVDEIDGALIETGAADFSLDERLWARGALGLPEEGEGEPDPEAEVVEGATLDVAEPEPELEAEAEPEPEVAAEPEAEPEPEIEGEAPAETDPDEQRLATLMDRLVADEQLFAPLDEGDDPLVSAAADADEAVGEPETTEAEDEIEDLRRFDEDAEAESAEGPPRSGLFRVIGRYLRRETEMVAPVEPAPEDIAEPPAEEPAEPVAEILPPDAESVERVSRYNFDELSRILTDKVGDLGPQAPSADEAASLADAPTGSVLARAARNPGELINLGGETLVLNRLPLGILVFRDQQVLFANRAITEMTGYPSVEALRSAGLGAIFPGSEGEAAGPVNHLVQRDGTLVPVTARLQSISWQGRPALMLSASTTEVRTGHEGAVRAFAEAFAQVRGDGFFETNRSGAIRSMNAPAIAALGLGESAPLGKPLADFVSQPDLGEFRDFLERPARFAETARPALRVKAAAQDAEFLIFAQGMAGVVSGYFGFVHRIEAPHEAPRIAGPAEPDAALLARVSRGVRRPLNTIIGFSDLIGSAAFGKIENERYLDYANDIKTAGHEIAALVDELDDYARLKDGRYLPQRASIDLMGLLESCVVRIRPQAGLKRVIVRNAISERLPRVTADRASLAQAVLNLLASAIDQTPVGGAVVISAQQTDDGGIAIHVRDSSRNGTDLSERFVVFRDGVGRDGRNLTPVRSSVGLALTRSLLAVNAFSLSVDPAGSQGMLFSMVIPSDLVEKS